MAARTSLEEQKRRRRKRLIKGLLLGGAAVGLPALANALISRRRPRLENRVWGRTRRYAWKHGECAFQSLGEGDSVVLIHTFGPGHDAEEWRSVAEHLSANYHIYALDLLGWGRSDKPAITYDGELYIQLIVDFLEDVVGPQPVVAASGLSAAYAVQAAVDHPELTSGLALVGPSGIELHGDEPDLKDALVHRLLRLPILGTSALNLFTSRAALGQYLRREIFRSPEQADAARIDHHYQSSHQLGAHAPLAAYLSGYLNHRIDEAVALLSVPLWLAWGRQATAPPVEVADLWLHRFPRAELEVFESSGNLPHLEVPGHFSRQLERFLARLSE